MFTKCANWNCSQQFRYSRGAIVFRVETPAGPASNLGEPSVGSQVDYHWLCAECLRVILISVEDHWPGMQSLPGTASGGPTKIVKLTSLDAALAELAKTTDWAQNLDLAQTKDVPTLARVSERVNEEGRPGRPGFEESISSGVSHATAHAPARESMGEADSSRLEARRDHKRDDKENDKWNNKPNDERGLATTF